MRVNCSKLPLLRREILVEVRSLPSSHWESSGLVLILKQKDKKKYWGWHFNDFFVTSSVDLMHYSQCHLIRSLFLVRDAVVPYVLNCLNLLGLIRDAILNN